ncbi:MAG: ABC transporter substrate-binding protein [Acidobacteriota bacterium]|nr:ABC transporter substrate-binding protein [Acidobacteriota bacterium]
MTEATIPGGRSHRVVHGMRWALDVCLVGVAVALTACVTTGSTSPPVSPGLPEPAPPQPRPDPEEVFAVEIPTSEVPGPEIVAPVPVATDPPDLPVVTELECALSPGGSRQIDTVALTEPIDGAHAPRPTNHSERFVFRQLYDTLVRVDCDGRLRPGLALSWRPDTAPSGWVVTLREDARFTDGRPVTSADVLSSLGSSNLDGWLRPHVRPFVRSVVALSPGVLAVTLRGSSEASVRSLAEPALAVAKREPGRVWPLGSTAFRVVEQRATPTDGELTIAREASELGQIRILIDTVSDPRDRLDAGVDLLVSREPAVLAYATDRPDVTSVPLPWTTTHVLLSPARDRLARAAPGPDPLAVSARERLATDAVRGEARGARGGFWWETTRCPSVVDSRSIRPSDVATGGATPRVLYQATDPVADDVSARLVGLAAFGDPEATSLLRTLFPLGFSGLASVGLETTVFSDAIASGDDAGYLLALERQSLDPCQAIRTLLERATWLEPTGRTLSSALVPLVETRAWALLGRNIGGVVVDWDGVVVMTAAREAGR